MRSRGIGILCAVSLLLAFFVGCEPRTENHQTEPSAPLTVGFSQMEMTNPWRIAETISIQETVKAHGMEIAVRDADSSVDKQISDCMELLDLPVDYLVLAPRVADGYQSVFQAAGERGIPVILVDRDTEGEAGKDYLCSIMADFELEARNCARILAEKFDGRPCRIVELTGTEESSVARIRSRTFREEIKKYPNMEIVLSASGDFVRTTAQTAMENILQTEHPDFNAIFAHDDDTGIGAIQALKGAGLKPGTDVMVVSIAGQKDALKAIIAGELLASVECDPRLGERVCGAIESDRNGKTVKKQITYTGMVYDISNAEKYYDNAF